MPLYTPMPHNQANRILKNYILFIVLTILAETDTLVVEELD
jgi:hypothetical protein